MLCLISIYAVEIPDVSQTSKLNWLYQISSIDTGELGDDHKLNQRPKSQPPYLLPSLIQKPKHNLHIYVLPVYITTNHNSHINFFRVCIHRSKP